MCYEAWHCKALREHILQSHPDWNMPWELVRRSNAIRCAAQTHHRFHHSTKSPRSKLYTFTARPAFKINSLFVFSWKDRCILKNARKLPFRYPLNNYCKLWTVKTYQYFKWNESEIPLDNKYFKNITVNYYSFPLQQNKCGDSFFLLHEFDMNSTNIYTCVFFAHKLQN